MNTLKKYLLKFYHLGMHIYYKLFTNNTFRINVHKRFFVDGDKKYLLNHSLNTDSIVFEVGGYTGVYTEKLIKKYNCYIYVFEPVKEFYDILVLKFKDNPKIKLFDFGLSDKNEKIEIYKSDDGTSIYKNNGEGETITLVDISKFIETLPSEQKHIDLIQINIEGGEYVLLEKILKDNNNLFKTIQIQFHDFVDNADEKRNQILNLLKENNYHSGFSFPFVREFFKKK